MRLVIAIIRCACSWSWRSSIVIIFTVISVRISSWYRNRLCFKTFTFECNSTTVIFSLFKCHFENFSFFLVWRIFTFWRSLLFCIIILLRTIIIFLFIMENNCCCQFWLLVNVCIFFIWKKWDIFRLVPWF